MITADRNDNQQLCDDRRLFWISAVAFGICWLIAGVAHAQEGTASWYSTECCRYNRDPRCPTASGKSLYQLEQDGALFAAMWNVPLGTSVRVCRAFPNERARSYQPRSSRTHDHNDDTIQRANRDTRPCVIVRVIDRGPARRLGRLIDLSKAAFRQLADPRAGTLRVSVDIVAKPS